MTDQQLATVPTVDAGASVPNGVGDLDVVRIYNPDLDAYGEAPRAGVQFLSGWEVVEPTPDEAAQLTGFDPAAHSAKEVVEYLETATDGERDAVLALERDGKNRKTVVEWAPPEPLDQPDA